ncbi:MAG: hypothetical protein PHF67_04210 [Candidatus Nanoarchaeia archaeon]|nr:hypothetical protein [Candidatus Nanoarchaeia archaeon]
MTLGCIEKNPSKVQEDEISLEDYYKRVLLTLQEPPGEYSIDELSSFFCFGLDLKITPLNQVQVIEVNGLNSGMKGYKDARVTLPMPLVPPLELSPEELLEWFPFVEPDEFHANQKQYYGFYLFIRNEFIKNLKRRSKDPEFALKQDLQFLGIEPISYIGARLAKEDLDTRDRFGLGWLIRDKELHPEKYPYCPVPPDTSSDGTNSGILQGISAEWDRKYGHFAELMHRMQLRLFDKQSIDQCFDECRNFKPRTYLHKKSDLKRLGSDYNPEYVVTKPKKGILGDGFKIRTYKGLLSCIQNNPKLVIEPFVQSKPILCKRDSCYHDGCMRYVILVEEPRVGDIKIRHYGGYWRLCPNPISDFPKVGSVRANLDKGAIPQKVSKLDLSLVAKAVDEFVPKFYRSLVYGCRQELAA